MTGVSSVLSESVDDVFSSHNISHLYPHEVPTALVGFTRVLKQGCIRIITCPDLKSMCALDAEDKLTQSSVFKSEAILICSIPFYDLWAVASKEELPEEKMKALTAEHVTPV
jgi:hypothetical protein